MRRREGSKPLSPPANGRAGVELGRTRAAEVKLSLAVLRALCLSAANAVPWRQSYGSTTTSGTSISSALAPPCTPMRA